MQFARFLAAWVLAVVLFGAVQAFAAPSSTAVEHANPNASLSSGGKGKGGGSSAASAGAASAAASTTGLTGASLNLSGQVSVSCTVTVASTAKAASLDLKAGEQNATVGVVTENCNSGNGYTVSITSQHGGQLRSAAGDASAPLASYTASYDDAVGSIASGLTATRNGAFFGRTGNLVVSVPANAQAIAGNYADSLTVVIAAK